MKNWKPLLGTMRLPFVILAPACVLVGLGTAYWQTGHINWFYSVLALIAGISAHISVNAFNEYFDFKTDLDARTRELLANPAARSEALNSSMAAVVQHPEFGKRMIDAVRRGNEHLAHVETIRRFILLERDLSQEHGELTPTMKVKRRELLSRYAERFNQLYDDESVGFSV